MHLTSRHAVALLIVIPSLILAVFLVKDAPAYAGIVGVAGGVIAVLYAGNGVTAAPATAALVDAVRRASRGEIPQPPAATSGGALKGYDELAHVAGAGARPAQKGTQSA